MHLVQKDDHLSWIQEVQHLPLEPKIIAMIGDISLLLRLQRHLAENIDTKPQTYNVRPIIHFNTSFNGMISL